MCVVNVRCEKKHNEDACSTTVARRLQAARYRCCPNAARNYPIDTSAPVHHVNRATQSAIGLRTRARLQKHKQYISTLLGKLRMTNLVQSLLQL